ncbi:MAG: heavy metal translocating P-type ATPase [Ignavibacteria bacterium]
MTESNTATDSQLVCFHCGDICKDKSIYIEEKYFCCNSCKVVYEILHNNNLCEYYNFDSHPGLTPNVYHKNKYAFLGDESTVKQILDFSEGNLNVVTFKLPQMHCSSCIWLLENLSRLDKGILMSRVNFLEKKLSLRFDSSVTTLRKIVELLDSLGYEPVLNLESIEKKVQNSKNRALYLKLGIAGFSFGNIMLLSFPEYLGLNRITDNLLGNFFGYLNLFLALPVFFYAASDYFSSALKGLRKKIVNIDVPLSLGIATGFFRSVYDVVFMHGAGYFDSITGLVFFLLIGKIFQNKTYSLLDFENSYKTYFPLAVSILKDGEETSMPVTKLKPGNRVLIRNGEIIPADSILFKGEAFIDYSFVTGESSPVTKVVGEIIYAGGRQRGEAIEVEIVKEVSQSYLTQLWNNDLSCGKHFKSDVNKITNFLGKYFTWAVFLVATVTSIYWGIKDSSKVFDVLTAVLIVACPCVIALSIPFTFGNMMRIFGKNSFYLKNSEVIEKLSRITTIVFDKTGTLTQELNSHIEFIGATISDYELSLVKSLVRNSTHPLSRKLFSFLREYETFIVNNFTEIIGEGIQANIEDNFVKIGSYKFVAGQKSSVVDKKLNVGARVWLSINDEIKGCFLISDKFREGFIHTLEELRSKYKLHLLSGDVSQQKDFYVSLIGQNENLHFDQKPDEKLRYINNLQRKGEKVLMIGDGLNDAGALMVSNVGISVSDDITNFSPSCDAILEGDSFYKLARFLKLSKQSVKIILLSFVFSLMYNVVGLSFAVQGVLSPLVAAVLMPVSSISTVLYCIFTTNLISKKQKLNL